MRRRIELSEAVKYQLMTLDEDAKKAVLEMLDRIAEDPSIGVPVKDLPEGVRRALLADIDMEEEDE